MSQRPERARFAEKPAAKPAGALDMILIGRLVLAAALLIASIFVGNKIVKCGLDRLPLVKYELINKFLLR